MPPRPVVWYKDPVLRPGPAPSVARDEDLILPRGLCLPNLVPGGPDPPMPGQKPRKRRETKVEKLERWRRMQSLSLTPTPSPARGGSSS